MAYQIDLNGFCNSRQSHNYLTICKFRIEADLKSDYNSFYANSIMKKMCFDSLKMNIKYTLSKPAIGMDWRVVTSLKEVLK